MYTGDDGVSNRRSCERFADRLHSRLYRRERRPARRFCGGALSVQFCFRDALAVIIGLALLEAWKRRE